MRISDWSSDVCSSDLEVALGDHGAADAAVDRRMDPGELQVEPGRRDRGLGSADAGVALRTGGPDRKSAVQGKSVYVRVDIGGRRILKKKTNNQLLIHTAYKDQQ